MDETFYITTSSPQANDPENNKPATRGFKPKYPWRSLMVGQSFVIRWEHINQTKEEIEGKVSIKTLKESANKWGRKLGRIFQVIIHPVHGVEIARKADPIKEQTIETFIRQQPTEQNTVNFFETPSSVGMEQTSKSVAAMSPWAAHAAKQEKEE